MCRQTFNFRKLTYALATQTSPDSSTVSYFLRFLNITISFWLLSLAFLIRSYRWTQASTAATTVSHYLVSSCSLTSISFCRTTEPSLLLKQFSTGFPAERVLVHKILCSWVHHLYSHSKTPAVRFSFHKESVLPQVRNPAYMRDYTINFLYLIFSLQQAYTYYSICSRVL